MQVVDIHIVSGISIVSTLSPTTIYQQSNARLNFSIASTSNVTSSANCTITLAVTALPLWSKVNKIDTVTLPISILMCYILFLM